MPYLDQDHKRLMEREWYERNKEAVNARKRAWRAANKEKVAAMKTRYYEANKEKIAAKNREYGQTNKEKISIKSREYAERFPERVVARNALNRNPKCVPPWYGELDELVVAEAVDLRNRRRALTGFDWHIDHVVPIKGRNVSGLHVWNNVRVVPEIVNRKKFNKHL